MVSVTGATTAIPLVAEYNNLANAIAAAQAALAGGVQIQNVQADAQVQGQETRLYAPTPMSATDSATVFNTLITIWTNMQSAVASQIAAIN